MSYGSAASGHTGQGLGGEHKDGSDENGHHAEHSPEKLFGGLRLISDEHTPDYARFNPADPLAGLHSERLRANISRQAFRESDAETQDALIAQRAGVRYVEPGRTISPMMARLLEKVATGDVAVPSANAIANARALVLRDLVPEHGPHHTPEHHTAHGLAHRPDHALTHGSADKPTRAPALPSRPSPIQASKGREREM